MARKLTVGRPWTRTDDARLTTLFDSTLTVEEIAYVTNRTRDALVTRCRRLGLSIIERQHRSEIVARRRVEALERTNALLRAENARMVEARGESDTRDEAAK
jgi:hypothetical protein